MSDEILLFIVFVIVILCDMALGWFAWRRHRAVGRTLGGACFGAAVVTVCYLISVFVKNYFWYSVLSSLYFMGIDVTLLYLAAFVRHFTASGKAGTLGKGWKVLMSWTLVDMIILAINPFREIAIRYIPREAPLSHYTYEMRTFYYLHLLLAYVMLAVVLVYLIRKIFHVPSVYRRQYYYAVMALILVVAINGVYLFSPADDQFHLDYSLLGYSLAAVLFYWSCYVYVPNGLLNQLRMEIFEGIDQAILLFDFESDLVMKNSKARETFGETSWRDCYTMESLLDFLDVQESRELFRKKTGEQKYSFQCYPLEKQGLQPMRCDYTAILSKHGEVLGRLFVFSELSSEYDSLTGFYSWETYEQKHGEGDDAPGKPVTAAACDLNGLANMNKELGRNVGDQAIQILARYMRECFPADTFFLRGREAVLVAVCEGRSEKEVGEILKTLKERVSGEVLFGKKLEIESAVKYQKPPLSQAETVRGAMDALQVRKLLDQNSRHSDLLYSLIQALQECDPDTEAHVRRTQKMGARLGVKIGLTADEQGKLALLAILHDIGKIGIPLDILNKPGKLTDAEWNVLKTHVEKGYQIASSSEGLRGIAEMILCHHERWDGRGYPNGLAGESIPLLSRMISVVDAYDAMVNDRSYRPAMPKPKACAELKRCAGTQFDPNLVEAFLELLKEDGIEAEDPQAKKEEKETKPVRGEWSVPGQKSAAGSEWIPRVHVMRYSVYVVSLDMKILRTDFMFEQLTGYSPEDVKDLGLTQMDLIFEEERQEYAEAVQREFRKDATVYLEHRIRRKDGTPLYVYCYGRRYYESAERAEHMEITISDSAASYYMQQAGEKAEKSH